MTEYVLMTEDGEPKVCDNCSFPAPLAEFDHPTQYKPRGVIKFLCEVCACSQLSIATDFPSQCTDEKLYRSLAWIANKLMSVHRPPIIKESKDSIGVFNPPVEDVLNTFLGETNPEKRNKVLNAIMQKWININLARFLMDADVIGPKGLDQWLKLLDSFLLGDKHDT